MQVWHYGSDIYAGSKRTYDERVVRQFWGRAAEGVLSLLGASFFMLISLVEPRRARMMGPSLALSLILPGLAAIGSAPHLMIGGRQSDPGVLHVDLDHIRVKGLAVGDNCD